MGIGEEYLGTNGWERLVNINKGERQRVWDNMRAVAQERYARGEMPSWFNPKWLAQEEAPVNAILREMGMQHYQYDDTWLGRPFTDPSQDPETEQGGPGDGGSGGRPRHGRGWWRDDDPYWMLRDWGDHPMRWWTLGFAGLLALGGLGAYLVHGSTESLLVGWGAAAWLSLCSLAMSDMRAGWHGPMGVKMAWAACALVGVKDGVYGWSHRPRQQSIADTSSAAVAGVPPPPWAFLIPSLPSFSFGGCGWSCAAMCASLMLTNMSGLDEWALPTTPGAVYKSSDVVLKHRVWKFWGYANVTMRQ